MILNPLQVKAAALGILVVAVVILALTGWAFFERSRYFECKATNVRLEDQVTVLGDKLERLSGAVVTTGKLGQQAVANTRQMLEEAKRLGKLGPDVSASEAAANAPTPAGKDCRDAQVEIRAERAGKPQEGGSR